jgi:SAM-dependent methyltransferase
MRWLLKSAAQSAFAIVPWGRSLNRLLQGDIISKHIPAHMENLQRLSVVLNDSIQTAVEVGTGWCPTIPLALTRRGIRVHTYDQTRFVTAKAITKAQVITGGNWEVVTYHAPGDAAITGLCDESIDLHFSFSVFEHIPVDVLSRILAEAYRVLRPGGVLYHRIDCRDHFCDCDSSITSVNFLRFSKTEWSFLAQNRIHYHNRLRGSDFVVLFKNAGFEIINAQADVCARGLAELGHIRIADQFQGYEQADLATSFLTVLATKPIQYQSAQPTPGSQRVTMPSAV